MCARDPVARENSGRLQEATSERKKVFAERAAAASTRHGCGVWGGTQPEKRKGPDSETRELRLGEGVSV